MEYWRLVKTSTRQKSLVVRLMRDVESNHFHIPIGFDALTRYRTEDLSLQSTALSHQVDLPEKTFLRAFLAKYPEAKNEPVALGSFTPSMARRFVQRQMQLMREGSNQAAAFAQAELDFSQQLLDMRRRQLGSLFGSDPLELQLQQEQEQLDEGLVTLAQQRLEAGGGGDLQAH
ncbi:hypothetical protein VOLCADRAFT_120480 [Volvox carteri f. nagariensis]|uniref:Uncharacterized protein n=1 Tax=Volvox carteri f. nagariensis TaxID=3068 RepID=D8TM92_VOLCA|nr:uncharacterized protein VOLCADRAFT_120480 [Volvox carteri f. nagariensis]EFJ51601.1 hypothetical protein VOLCADRAFT_120480 [Volvox carteri f. nagariensis]|eukprot:XP_002947553.1 hypothetical protein VOLCADRAFT_120480 [Volvox carteri f. nagariensis]